MMLIPRWQQPCCLFLLSMVIGLSACESERSPEATAPVEPSEAAARRVSVPTATNSSMREVIGETLPYAEIEEELVYGYFTFPADMTEPLPAVILIHDRWGMDDAARQLSERLAAEGYIVVAVDLFNGEIANAPGPARLLEIDVFENPDLAADNILQAYRFVKDNFGAERIASLGFGFGGGWSLNAALLLPNDLSASVIYYGQVIDDTDKLQPLQVPVLGLFAENDRVITTHSVLAFEASLDALEKEFEIEIFTGAARGFSDTKSPGYDGEIEGLAWNQTLDFLKRQMVDKSN